MTSGTDLPQIRGVAGPASYIPPAVVVIYRIDYNHATRSLHALEAQLTRVSSIAHLSRQGSSSLVLAGDRITVLRLLVSQQC
jgi:hypothetical protein